MEFIRWLNSNVFLLAVIEGFILFISFRLAFLNNWRTHIGFIFVIMIFSQYLLITPFFHWYKEIYLIIGTDIREYFGLAFFYNIIGLLAFMIGYWSINSNDKNWEYSYKRELENPASKVITLYFIFYAIVIVNMAAGGINIRNLFLGDEIAGLGVRGFSYFFQNFADTLITLIILAYLYKLPYNKFIPLLISAIFIFSLLGFRYRIMLTLFGIGLIFLLRNKITISIARNLIFISILFFYMILFSTANRFELIQKNYNELLYNPLKYDSELIFYQTRSGVADIAIYKLFNNSYQKAEHDYGITMFGYVFIRMIPRSIYQDKDRFYPPPQLKTTIQAYDAYWAKFSGESTTHYGAFYIAYGWFGIILLHFIWGILLAKFTYGVRMQDPLSIAGYIVLTVVSFQWISRGYFPQIIDNFIYMMIPIWVLRRIAYKLPE
jgi:hypothetical protein